MQIDSTLAIGSSKLAVSGTAPLTPNGRFDLKATGTADLSLFNGDLTATGRRLLGQAIVDGVVRGTLAAPDISGGAKLTNVEFHDSANGVRLTGISGDAAFRGSTVEIVNLSGRAGAGTVRLNGSINLAAPGVPVQLVVTARNAEPVSSDQFTARIDADVTLTGTIAGGLKAAGKIAVLRAESVLPNSLPPEVANLDVKRPGKPVVQPAPQVRPSTIALDLNVTSPGQFFLRGRGLDTELSGDVHVGGTVSAPVITGAFEMRRGTFDLGGTTLNFTSGKVTFETGSLRNRIDPAIDFVAQSSTGGYTAKLEISGTVSNPKVQLSSTPTLPQDEILAQVLFQQNVKQLSALQLAQMAQAAASLGGLSGGFDPIGSARRVLGLDRLSVGTGPNNQTQVEAGKYVLRNVYVGAKQGLSNAPQAEVQVDLTQHLKAKATIATGNNSAAVTQGAQQQDPGTSAGLSWQFEY
jgi:translocation and assembly module TamB